MQYLRLYNKVHGIITGSSQISTADETANFTHCFASSLFFQQLSFIFICSVRRMRWAGHVARMGEKKGECI
jgi:hypothetical protein